MGVKLSDKIFEKRLQLRLTREFERVIRGDARESELFSPRELERMLAIELHKIAELNRNGDTEGAARSKIKFLQLERILEKRRQISGEESQSTGAAPQSKVTKTPPQFGERLLLLILRTKEERANIPGDLEEEFRQIAAKHGARYAKLWYYKQVATSAWPIVRKALRWGILAWVGEWIRRIV